jgi:two-component system LytT family response regulator
VRVVIVDDEPLARRGVKARLAQHPDIQVVAECSTGRTAVTALVDHTPDLVFLDVQMPDLSGFEALRKIPANKLPFIIFLTAYDRYAVDAFELHALDYLLKPIDDARFSMALEYARSQIKARSVAEIESRLRELLQHVDNGKTSMPYETRFAVRSGRRTAIVSVDDIDWIEASGDYVTLHTSTRSHLLRETMNRLEQQLNPTQFLRIHRSAIVQASRICELVSLENREYLLRLTNGTTLKASRNFSERIDRWL